MTRKESSKTVKIYKSHKLKNGFISITYAYVIDETTVSSVVTVEVEDKGGVLASLWMSKIA